MESRAILDHITTALDCLWMNTNIKSGLSLSGHINKKAHYIWFYMQIYSRNKTIINISFCKGISCFIVEDTIRKCQGCWSVKQNIWLNEIRYSIKIMMPWYSISQEICTRFCCALFCCGYAIVRNEFTWSIYPYSSGLLCWHWGNR